MPAKAAVVPAATGLLSCVVGSTHIVPRALCGWSLVETGGSASALVTIYDGTSAAGVLLAEIELVKSTDETHTFDEPLQVASGAIWVVVAGSGVAAGSIDWE